MDKSLRTLYYEKVRLFTLNLKNDSMIKVYYLPRI